MKTKLVVVGGRATKREVVLELPAKIGRHSEAALTVIHPTVSRNHCELVERDGRVVLRDLGSTNGTFVADQRITEVVLDPGGRFTIGPLTFTAEYVPVNGSAGHPATEPELRFDEPASVEQSPAIAAAAETIVQPASNDHLSLQDDDDLALAPLDSAVEDSPVEVEPAASSDDLQLEWESDELAVDAVDEADSAELSINLPADEAADEQDFALASDDEFDLKLEPVSDADDELGFAIEAEEKNDEDVRATAVTDKAPAKPDAFSVEKDDSSRDMSVNDLLLDDLPAAELPLSDAAPAEDPAALGEEDAFGWELTPAADDDHPSLGLPPASESQPAASDDLQLEGDDDLARLDSPLSGPAEADLPPLVSDDEDLRFLLDDPESVPPVSHEPQLSDAHPHEVDELALDDDDLADPVVESVEFDLALDDEPSLEIAAEPDFEDQLALQPPIGESPQLKLVSDDEEFSLAEPAEQVKFAVPADEASSELSVAPSDEPLSFESTSDELSLEPLEPLDLHVAAETACDDELAIEPLEFSASDAAESLEFQLEDDDLAPLSELRDGVDDLSPLASVDEPVDEIAAEPVVEPAAEPVVSAADADDELALDLEIESDEFSEFDMDDFPAASPPVESLNAVDSPEPVVPEELSLDAPDLEGLAIEEPKQESPAPAPFKPLPTGPVEPWQFNIAEPIVTDASHQVAPLPEVPADEMDYLDFDQPDEPLELSAAEEMQPAAPQELAPQGAGPLDEPLARQDAEEDFFLDLDSADESAPAGLASPPVDLGADEPGESSDPLGLDDLADEPLNLPGSEAATLDFDEPVGEPEADAQASSAEASAAPKKKKKGSWWPFGRKKQDAAAESAKPKDKQAGAVEPDSTETLIFNEPESAASDEASFEPIENLELSPDELAGLDQLRTPKIVDNFELEEEMTLDFPSISDQPTSQPTSEIDAPNDLDDSALRETQAIEFDPLSDEDPLAGLEEKESMLLEEIEQGGDDLSLGGLPELTDTHSVSETVAFEPARHSGEAEAASAEAVAGEAPMTETPAEPAAKRGFRWWPFGRKGPAQPKPPKVKKEKVKKEKKKKDKKGASISTTAVVPSLESLEPESSVADNVEDLELSFDDDAPGLAPLGGESGQAFSDDDAIDFMSDDVPSPGGKSATTPGQQAQTTGKSAGEISDLDLDEFLKDI